MKLLFGTFSIALIFLLSATSMHAQNNRSKAKAGKPPMQDLPYTAEYSSQFEIGDPSLSSIVLNAWKTYDDNTFAQSNLDFIADTVRATMGNGMTINGKDSFVNGIKAFRAQFSAVKSEVVAYMSVKSTDRGGQLVLIWGTESDTRTDGSIEKADLHEVWGFNKDGKVDFFKQFVATVPK